MDSSDKELVQQDSVRKAEGRDSGDDADAWNVAENEENVTEYMTSSDISEYAETKREGTESKGDDLKQEAWKEQYNR